MKELINIYFDCICQVALITDDVNGFLSMLDFSDECFNKLCDSLLVSLEDLNKKDMVIPLETNRNIRILIDLLVPRLNKEMQVNMRNALISNVNLLQSNSTNIVSKEKNKSILYYVDILKAHSIKVPSYDLSDTDYLYMKKIANHLVYNDYLILEQLLLLPMDRDYDSISLLYYENSLSFFLNKNKDFKQYEDFKQLKNYLKKRSFDESLLGKIKKKGLSIIKKY